MPKISSVDEAVGGQILEAIGSQTTIRGKDFVNLIKGFLQMIAATKREDDLVECPLHVKGGGKGCLAHPDDAKAAVIGHHFARRDAVEIFR